MKKETPVLKYAAILMIVFGAVEAAVGIRGFFEISALHEAAAELQLANPIPVLITSGIFTMLIAVSELIAGILGYFYRARPAKAAACLVCGFISLSLAVLSDGYALFFYPAGFSMLTLPLDLILPIIYLVGAYQHQKRNKPSKSPSEKRELPISGSAASDDTQSTKGDTK